MNQIQILQSLYSSFEDKVKTDDWLSNLNYSEAFVVCIGAGPWKFARRRTIQGQVLQFLAGKDLSVIDSNVKWYPLNWQNNITNSLIQFLGTCKCTMLEFCADLKRSKLNSRKTFYMACGVPKGCKVLSLYCRDKLNIDAFPIDRHVRKFLKKHKLPDKENEMIVLCKEAGLNPREVASGIVKSFGAVKNPKW